MICKEELNLRKVFKKNSAVSKPRLAQKPVFWESTWEGKPSEGCSFLREAKRKEADNKGNCKANRRRDFGRRAGGKMCESSSQCKSTERNSC